MTQPKFAPILEQDEVRPGYQLGVPQPGCPIARARADPLPAGQDLPGLGVRGPDQGYALELATMFADRLVLEPGEHAEDVLAGAVAIALRRAAIFGRAPIATDIDLALDLFGYLSRGAAPGFPRPRGVAPGEVRRGGPRLLATARAFRRRPGGDSSSQPAGVSERLEAEPDGWRELAGA